MRLRVGEASKGFASVVVAAVTLWGSRLIVMVANILGGGGGGEVWMGIETMGTGNSSNGANTLQPFIECRSSGRRKISNS